jgi:diguanylate cyclase (GGDEF)-like protein
MIEQETIDRDTLTLAGLLADQAVYACVEESVAEALVADEARSELRLLDSLAAFTHHRDIDALDHSLVLTLAQLTSAHSVILAKRGFDEASVGSVVRCARDGSGTYLVHPVQPGRIGSSPQLLHGGLDRLESRTELVNGLHRQVVPLLREGRAIGALQLDSRMAPSTSRQLIDGFARIYANYTALLHESEQDKLTGLYNRRSLERQLQRLLQQRNELLRQVPAAPPVAHEQCPAPAGESLHVWLGILDIDHFKRINDNFGHIYGDEVILLLAQQMRACFRQGDALFRYGGEEFVILFSATDEVTVQAVLDRFRQRIADYEFPQIGHITISIGYAKIGEHDYPASAVDRADQALYFVKQHGRNGIRGYEELGASGLLEHEKVAGTVDLF